MEPNWFADPLGRFEGRFFDGEQWTNQVSDLGVFRLDPDWPEEPAEPEFVGDDRRTQGDRRQVTMRVDVERRSGDRRKS